MKIIVLLELKYILVMPNTLPWHFSPDGANHMENLFSIQRIVHVWRRRGTLERKTDLYYYFRAQKGCIHLKRAGRASSSAHLSTAINVELGCLDFQPPLKITHKASADCRGEERAQVRPWWILSSAAKRDISLNLDKNTHSRPLLVQDIIKCMQREAVSAFQQSSGAL